jgi:hypothetical protein
MTSASPHGSVVPKVRALPVPHRANFVPTARAWNSQPVPETISIPSRFNGPSASGHGGYCSAVFAGLVDGHAEVTLRSPVPLETALDVQPQNDGSAWVLDGDTLVAQASPLPELDLEVPSPVSPEDARLAKERYRGKPDDVFSRCFVCGLSREDAFGVFAGNVDGRELVASPWTPPDWTADESGHVRPEFVWAVMDCPTYFAVYSGADLPMSFLGRMAARVDRPVAAGEEHVVMAWPLDTDGRKRHAGAAVLSSDGAPLAVARALMIEPRQEPAA